MTRPAAPFLPLFFLFSLTLCLLPHSAPLHIARSDRRIHHAATLIFINMLYTSLCVRPHSAFVFTLRSSPLCVRPHSAFVPTLRSSSLCVLSSLCVRPHSAFVPTLRLSSLRVRPHSALVPTLRSSPLCACPHSVFVLSRRSSFADCAVILTVHSSSLCLVALSVADCRCYVHASCGGARAAAPRTWRRWWNPDATGTDR